jgi:hypothetical protein
MSIGLRQLSSIACQMGTLESGIVVVHSTRASTNRLPPRALIMYPRPPAVCWYQIKWRSAPAT